MATVIIPWRGGDPQRERAWAWVARQYADKHPGWSLVRSDAAPGPWRKATAVMPAVRRSRSRVIVIADADVWTHGLAAAVEQIEFGAGWAMPHRDVIRLTEDGTAALIQQRNGIEAAGDHLVVTNRYRASIEIQGLPFAVEETYPGVEGGGVVVASRDTLLEVPLDARFEGWGQEDESHAIALRCLYGPPWRGTPPLFHLWHPPADRHTRRRGLTGMPLRRRYGAARNDPAAMRRLLAECSPT